MADHDLLRTLGAHQPGEGGGHIRDECRVDLFADHPADVICLDDCIYGLGGAWLCHAEHTSSCVLQGEFGVAAHVRSFAL